MLSSLQPASTRTFRVVPMISRALLVLVLALLPLASAFLPAPSTLLPASRPYR